MVRDLKGYVLAFINPVLSHLRTSRASLQKPPTLILTLVLLFMQISNASSSHANFVTLGTAKNVFAMDFVTIGYARNSEML